MPTIRQRFDTLRKAMNWAWADIDRITGRKNAATNITKRVPAWAHLAIETHETYEPRLQLHVIDSINQRLGDEWQLTPTSTGTIIFQPLDRPEDQIELSFTPASFSLQSKARRLEGLVEQLAALYPYHDQATPDNFTFSLIDQQNRTQTLQHLKEERKVMF